MDKVKGKKLKHIDKVFHKWYSILINDWFMKHRNLPLAQLDRATAF